MAEGTNQETPNSNTAKLLPEFMYSQDKICGMSHSDFERVLQMFEDPNNEFMKAMPSIIKQLQKPDFDPRIALKTLANRAAVLKLSRDQFMKDIGFLLYAAITRGSVSFKMATNPEFKNALISVMNRYQIKTKKSHHSDITLREVATCYVKSCSAILHKQSTWTPVVTPSDMGVPTFPISMCLSNFGYLLPSGIDTVSIEVQKQLFSAFCLHQYHFDRVINKKKRKTPLAEIQKYAEKQVKSSFYPTEERIEHLVKIGVLFEKDGKFILTDDVKDGIEGASDSWNKLVRDDVEDFESAIGRLSL